MGVSELLGVSVGVRVAESKAVANARARVGARPSHGRSPYLPPCEVGPGQLDQYRPGGQLKGRGGATSKHVFICKKGPT